jgi:alkanesulfonate monooxygenase SsuD/methylene tetrahydromethanopterin reductase-like flavin-dependent oxidoreductase (luciferase family)
MFDHMAKGRFIFGISPGLLASDAEVLGNLDLDKNRMFAESIDVILAIWERDPPYDIDFPDNRYKVSTARSQFPEIGTGIMYKPYQQPRPEIVGTVVAPGSKGVILMGARDFHPMSANFLLTQWLPSHWSNYAVGKQQAGQTADPADWRVARTLFVADDERTAREYGHANANSPYRFYYKQMFAKMKKGKRTIIFKHNEQESDDDVSLDRILADLVISGTVNQVVDGILKLREQIGDFGELVYAGMDWVDPALARRSMELMATEVMPRVNAAIAGETKSAAARA